MEIKKWGKWNKKRSKILEFWSEVRIKKLIKNFRALDSLRITKINIIGKSCWKEMEVYFYIIYKYIYINLEKTSKDVRNKYMKILCP